MRSARALYTVMVVYGIALPFFPLSGRAHSFACSLSLDFLVFLVFRFFLLLLRRFDPPFLFFHIFYAPHSLSPSPPPISRIFLFTLLWSHAETQKTNRQIRVYLYVCIMCWVAQSSRLFSCAVYAVFLCTAMLLLLLLPLHGQTFTSNPQSYAVVFCCCRC